MRLTLNRYWESEEATLGILNIEGNPIQTLELPENHNQRNVSRIPAGTYEMRIRERRGAIRIRLHGNGVMDPEAHGNAEGERFNNDIHVGNRVTEILGCILVALGAKYDGAFSAPKLLNSTAAMKILVQFVKAQKPAKCFLEIRDRF